MDYGTLGATTMDVDLKEYLEAMETRINAHTDGQIDAVEQRLKAHTAGQIDAVEQRLKAHMSQEPRKRYRNQAPDRIP